MKNATAAAFVAIGILALLAQGAAHATYAEPVRIGILTDENGVYADVTGLGSVIAAKMAVEAFGGSVSGRPVIVLDADHQNKTDLGVAIARRWYEADHVDVIADFLNSSIALAVDELAKQLGKATVLTSAASSAISGVSCTPNSIQWTYTSEALSKVVVKALRAAHAKTWYFLTVDYAFGNSLEDDARRQIEDEGGKVLGSVRHPLNTSDFSSFLLQAQNAHPDVLALTDTGANLVNAVKQAREFGLDQAEMRLASFLMQISELHAIGLADAKGMLLATAFDWNMNEQTRDFGKRFFEKGHRMPTMVQAGLYSAITHYLKAVQASGETTGKAVIDEMKKLPVHDFFAPDGIVRADGVLIHDFYLAQVKAPDESTEPWDYLKIVATIPGSEAFRPPAESKCPLAKQAPQQVE